MVLCSLFGLGMGTITYIPIYRSHQLLREISQLKVGVSDYSETERIASLLGMQKNHEVPCSVRECLWRVDVHSYLPGFWTSQSTTLTAGLRVESNQLVSVDIGFGKVHQPDFTGIMWSESIPSLWKTHSAADVGYRTDLSGRYLISSINVSPSATEEEKRKYLAFNLNCFLKFRGCNDVFEFLPVLRSDPRLHAQN